MKEGREKNWVDERVRERGKKMNKEWVWWLKSYSRPNFPYLTKNPCSITMCHLWTFFFYISAKKQPQKKYSSSIKPPSLCKRTSQKHLPAYLFPFLFLLSHTSSAGKQKKQAKLHSFASNPISNDPSITIKM